MTSATTTPTLLLVTGAGRSGTSTVAGALGRLGFVVPQPEVQADETNPRGFYEPRWAVDFDKRVLGSIPVRTNDARPEAVALTDAMADRPELVAELAEWLRPLAADPKVVVKDPRTFWLHRIWRTAAAEAGFEVQFLTMLRHPAQVAASRDRHYLADRDEAFRQARETTNVAAWCHGTLVTERVTRNERRAFVSYSQLMTDWRAALTRADEQLGSGVMASVDDQHHPVDDFIDVGLNRSAVGWADLSVHPEVVELAEGVWTAMERLAEDPDDTTVMAELDALHERYDRIYALAEALTLDRRNVDRDIHRRELRDQAAAKQRRIEKLLARVERLEARRDRLQDEVDTLNRSRALRLARRVRHALGR